MSLTNPFGSSYQVTEDDQDFLTLAANLGVDYDQLTAANPSVQSLSQGQFINVPNLTPSSSNPNRILQPPPGATFASPAPSQSLPGAPRPPLSGTSFSGWNAQNTAAQRGALSPATGLAIYQQSERGQTPANRSQTSLTGSFMPGGANNPQAQAAVIANTLNQSGFVPNVPITSQQMSILVNQYGANPALLAATHTFDPNTQQFKPKNDPNSTTPVTGSDFASTAAAQYNAQNNVPYLNQLRWDPKSRTYMPIGKILQKYGTLNDPRGRKGKREREEAPREEVRKEAPTTSLNLVLGG